MANKFQKSVQERLEQEAKLQKKIARKPAEEQSPAKSEQPPVTVPEQTAKPVVTTLVPQPTEAATKAPLKEEVSDIGSYLRRENERLAKNKTFYLDTQVIEELHRAAVGQKVTDSKLCNDILRRVLGID